MTIAVQVMHAPSASAKMYDVVERHKLPPSECTNGCKSWEGEPVVGSVRTRVNKERAHPAYAEKTYCHSELVSVLACVRACVCVLGRHGSWYKRGNPSPVTTNPATDPMYGNPPPSLSLSFSLSLSLSCHHQSRDRSNVARSISDSQCQRTLCSARQCRERASLRCLVHLRQCIHTPPDHLTAQHNLLYPVC